MRVRLRRPFPAGVIEKSCGVMFSPAVLENTINPLRPGKAAGADPAAPSTTAQTSPALAMLFLARC